MGNIETVKNLSVQIEPTQFISNEEELKDKVSPLRGESKIFKIIQDLTSSVANLAKPVGYFRIEEFKKKNGKISLPNNKLGTRHAVSLQLGRILFAFRDSKYAVLFICTIGNAIKAKLNEFNKDPIRSWLFDSLCSYLTEKVADELQARVASHPLANGLKPTHRFSPGYCDWDINEQRKLFHLFEQTKIEVSLNPGYMMNPRKSVSGIFGLSEKSVYETNPCRVCPDKNCLWKRA